MHVSACAIVCLWKCYWVCLCKSFIVYVWCRTENSAELCSWGLLVFKLGLWGLSADWNDCMSDSLILWYGCKPVSHSPVSCFTSVGLFFFFSTYNNHRMYDTWQKIHIFCNHLLSITSTFFLNPKGFSRISEQSDIKSNFSQLQSLWTGCWIIKVNNIMYWDKIA